MKKLLMLLLIITSFQFVYSQRVPKKVFELKENKNFISLTYNSGVASGFYDLNGKFVTSLWDSTSFKDTITNEPIHREYIFELQSYGIELGFNYNVADEFNITADIPITSYSLNERYVSKFIYDSLGYLLGNLPKMNKADFSRTRVDYFGLGANYKGSSDDLRYGANFQLRIPSSFESGQFDSSDTFLSDGAFAILVGGNIGYRMDKLTFDLASNYFFRTEDFKDQINSVFSVSFSGVEGTYIKGVVEYNKSMESFDNTPLLDYHREVVQDDYLAVGVGFKMLLGQDLSGEVNYRVKVSGTNSLNYNTFRITLGYSF